MTEDQAVRYRVSGGVATLTMDQPHNRNALTPALLGGLADGLAAALANDAVGAIELTHTGPAFCAGADLSGTPKPKQRRKELGLADVLEDIQDAPKPVVARIAGHCVGGGIGLAAASGWPPRVTFRSPATRSSSASPRSASGSRPPSSRSSACRSCAVRTRWSCS